MSRKEILFTDLRADALGQPELFDAATLANLAYLQDHPELLDDEPYAKVV